MATSDPAGFETLSELEARAASRIPPRVWEYVQGGAGDEVTLRANRSAYDRWSLHPRALRDVSNVSLKTWVLGREVSAPFLIAPTAYQREVHPDGEPGVARAASEQGVLATFSTLSSAPLEEIAAASGTGARWFQLYLQPEFADTRALVERAERARFDAIVLTVDAPVLGVRDRQATAGFAIDSSVPAGNGPRATPPSRRPEGGPVDYRLRAPADANWEVVDRVRASTSLPVVVKGILAAEDARLAVAHGARAVVVSNHGGRQLDRAPATLAVLPEVAAEVGDRAEVYVDGGVRRGSDVLIALALGARAVGVGRPILWALGVGGAAGVRRYLELLATDVAVALALVGHTGSYRLDREVVRPAVPPGP